MASCFRSAYVQQSIAVNNRIKQQMILCLCHGRLHNVSPVLVLAKHTPCTTTIKAKSHKPRVSG